MIEGDVNEGVSTFLQTVSGRLTNQRNNAIVRLAIFSRTYTTTVRLRQDSVRLLEAVGAELEISVYPTDD
jgi:hypothetical protein